MAERQMNVAAVKRVDPYATDIVETSTHVALYSFEENEWIKTEIEGALFVYARKGPPDHSVVVMNRLNTDNLIEPVAKGLELQLQEPFLLYRNSRRHIYGLWFYDKDECVRVARKIDELVNRANDISPATSSSTSAAPERTQRVDIFTMLTKAQIDYDKNNKSTQPPPKPRPPPVASQSVMEFFAKASGGGAPPPTFVRPPPDPDDPMTLQRLMSDPVHSVEHIEKQQRSTTPVKRSNGHAVPSDPNPPNGGRQQHKTKQPPTKTSVDTEDIITIPSSDAPPHTPQRPALMPPTMFTSSATKAPPDVAPAAVVAAVRPEPLTRNQLLQAFDYLVKHDADFVTKLHEAYVKSFSELVS